MKFLVDVCAGHRLANWLRSQGFEVLEVRDVDKRMLDEKIIEWGVRDSLVIVTLDKDFSKLTLFEMKNCFSIIRLQNVPVKQRIQNLEKVLNLHHTDLESGVIIIQKGSKLRVIRVS